MGMYDSFYIKCPKCGSELEFQSKTGSCALFFFKENNLPPEVAVGINKDIVDCEFCGNNFRLECKIPRRVKVKLVKTKEKSDYRGNYNPDTPKNKRESKKLRKILGLDSNAKGDGK